MQLNTAVVSGGRRAMPAGGAACSRVDEGMRVRVLLMMHERPVTSLDVVGELGLAVNTAGMLLHRLAQAGRCVRLGRSRVQSLGRRPWLYGLPGRNYPTRRGQHTGATEEVRALVMARDYTLLELVRKTGRPEREVSHALGRLLQNGGAVSVRIGRAVVYRALARCERGPRSAATAAPITIGKGYRWFPDYL